MTAPSESRVAIVTGATGGMGVKIVQSLCAQGWKVACLDLQQEAGDSLVESLGHENAIFIPTNLAKYEDQAHAFRETFRRWGRIDALCANAGIVDRSSVYIYNWRGKKADDVPPEPNLITTDVDYKAVIYGVQLATHFMRHNPQPGGRIVVTSSIASVFPHPSYPEYSGAKAAVNVFVQGIAPLLKQKENIHINCVLPGIVPTPIIPPEMIAAVAPEHLTPVETIVKAFNTFLEDTTGMTGELLECSGDKMIYLLSAAGAGKRRVHATRGDGVGAFVSDDAWRGLAIAERHRLEIVRANCSLLECDSSSKFPRVDAHVVWRFFSLFHDATGKP